MLSDKMYKESSYFTHCGIDCIDLVPTYTDVEMRMCSEL